MYCLSCGNSLSQEALFCEKCGKLTIKGMSERESESTTVASASSPSDPYYSRPSTSYGPLAPSGGTQNPYAPANPYEPLAPPPPPRHRTSPGFLKGLLSGMIVILLLSGGLGGWQLLRQGTLFPLPPHTQRPKATPPLPPTSTSVPQTVNISTQVPLSDGRVEAWKSTLHAHVIESRWTLSTGQWTPWTAMTYPPSNAGVTGLSADTQQNITYLTVRLDDGSCWQQQKLTTASDSDWTSFSSC